MPVGIAIGPFEFAIAVGYLLAGIRILTDSAAYAQIKAALFPSGGLLAWLVLLISASALIIVGQTVTVRWTIPGMHIERLGLISLSVALIGYVYAVWVRTGGVSIALETVGAIVLACLFKAATINTALEGARQRRGGQGE